MVEDTEGKVCETVTRDAASTYAMQGQGISKMKPRRWETNSCTDTCFPPVRWDAGGLGKLGGRLHAALLGVQHTEEQDWRGGRAKVSASGMRCHLPFDCKDRRCVLG